LHHFPRRPALGNHHGIADGIAGGQLGQNFRHAGTGRNAEVALLDGAGGFRNAAANLENILIGDQALLFQARRDGRQARAGFDAECGFLACGAVAVELGCAIDDHAASNQQAEHQQRQKSVEDIKEAIAGAAAAPLLAVIHRAGSPSKPGSIGRVLSLL